MLADRYELDHEIGRGGMGSVWLGHDTVLDRDVAIKQIGMVNGGGEPDLERAEREAHLAARINHQNVVAVFDLVDEDGYQWLVMEHVDGPTLADLITEQGPLDPVELAPVVRQVAGALAAAHDLGIVHRDVKPSNILLTHDGTAKLSDFGVARAQADASLTQTGLVTGSPAYLSPEVASGRTATAASDVWSLGAAVFHALSGRPPYSVGDNLLGAMYRIVNGDPPRLDGDDALTAAVTAMMQHDPDARPTMAEVERAVATDPPVDVDLESTQAFAAHPSMSEGTPTTTFRPLAPPVEPSTAPTRKRHTGVRRRTAWAAGVAAAVIAVVTFAALGNGEDPAVGPPSASAGSAEPRTDAQPDPEPGPPSAEPDGGEVSAEALEGFVADYLTTASNDPDTGFTMLTPAFQRESEGIEGYKGFWGDVKDLNVEQVSADPRGLKVSYTYSYDFKGDRRSDAVTLQLEQSGDSFLISGEA